MGLDFRFLLVFACAANIISGFTIIFGGKIRKGDWLEVAKGLGMVTDIYLRATKLRTRDNIEYLVPNQKGRNRDSFSTKGPAYPQFRRAVSASRHPVTATMRYWRFPRD